jgi:hypothetical protein
VSRSYVSLVEGGREKPSKRYRKAASRVLGVPEDLLFGDDDLPFSACPRAETAPTTSPASPPAGSATSASSTTTGTRKAAPSGGSRRTPTNGRSPSGSVSTRRLTTTEVDWERLSPRGKAILRQIAIPHSEGLLLIEIAVELKTSASWVSSRLLELADELEQLTG